MNLENNGQHKIVGIWLNICRFGMAVVLIFSGFVKAIDPLGTKYKIQDYLTAFGWIERFPEFFPFLAAILLGIVEFCLGIYLFFGIRRKITPRALVLIMSFMTPLTLWLAIDNPVSDCGCFGDAVVLSNWQTFWKNVALLVASLTIMKWRKRIFPLVTVRLDWLIGLYSFLFILMITGYCYFHLPLFDFRPYHIGANIREGMEIPEGKSPTVYDTRFIMQKGEEQKEFGLEDYPDSTWTFVDTKLVVKEKGYEPAIRDFSIVRQDDGEDITDEVLDDDNYTFLLIAHQLEEADDGSIDLINELYDYCLQYGYAFYALTSSSDEAILKWQDSTGAEYPFCLTDNTTLRTMIRSNPGVILLKKGTVLNKWGVNELPDEYQLYDRLENLPISQPDSRSSLYKVQMIVFRFVVPLFLICMADLYWERRKKKRDLLKQQENNLNK